MPTHVDGAMPDPSLAPKAGSRHARPKLTQKNYQLHLPTLQ